ncbi:MAG: ATP-binding protein [Propionibacteriaceae bacterium]|jgi:predicted AAA+ superfamily ATPase|nr:ATP-binding protein [Propionibacteriaceae bacterium]
MERMAMSQLLEWKNSPQRKPLILRGARQVGKTWLARQFGTQHYDNTLYVNFDAQSVSGPLKQIFEGDLDPQRIVRALDALHGQQTNPGSTLLILDEIQAVPRALTSLKYFEEQAPEYHVIAAGSHLGLNLHPGASLPVGKVNILRLSPLTFTEFLTAVGYAQIATAITDLDWELLAVLHDRVVELLRQYLFVGGMPEAVLRYAESKRLADASVAQRELLELIRADFSKHAPTAHLARLWQVWDSIPVHLAKENKKLVWGTIRPGARARDFELALQWLIDYGVAYPVRRVTKPGLPLAAYVEEGIFKLFSLDVGLLAAMAGLDQATAVSGDALFSEFRGALAEQYVHQQLVAVAPDIRPYYWAGKAAEIDFVMQFGPVIVPIEVKAGEARKSQSLRSYLDRFAPAYAVRMSMSRFRPQDTFTNVPLYAAQMLPAIIAAAV